MVEQTEQRAIIVKITPELLKRNLPLPANAQITGAQWNSLTHTLDLRLESPDLPLVPPGAVPMYGTIYVDITIE